MSFANDIKSIRQKCIISQIDFAKELGVAFSTVNRWEAGKALPNYKAMKAIDSFCRTHNINYDVTCIRSTEIDDET